MRSIYVRPEDYEIINGKKYMMQTLDDIFEGIIE